MKDQTECLIWLWVGIACWEMLITLLGVLFRSCFPSARVRETASCLSTTCCSVRTPALAPPNTSTWTTNVNPVSSVESLSPSPSSVSHHRLLHLYFPPHSAEHKRHVVCEGGLMILRCKTPRVLNIYAAVYGRREGQWDTCPSHLTRPPPFGESVGLSVVSHGLLSCICSVFICLNLIIFTL